LGDGGWSGRAAVAVVGADNRETALEVAAKYHSYQDATFAVKNANFVVKVSVSVAFKCNFHVLFAP
jgi:hypothetical protein